VHVRAAVPDVLLVIAGEGPARRQLEALARRLGLDAHVRFVGYLDRDGSLEGCYAAADAFVFASRTETQGLVLLESMALGTPVVATAEMGTREVLREGEGCLIAQDNELDFAAKTVRLLTDTALRELLIARARPYAERWSARAMAERMLGLYEKVCRERVGAEQRAPVRLQAVGTDRPSTGHMPGPGQAQDTDVAVRPDAVGLEEEQPQRSAAH
jgi:glycosyltransferase involved in cell wall biosynthesis